MSNNFVAAYDVILAAEYWWASAATSLLVALVARPAVALAAAADRDFSAPGACHTCWATTRAWAGALATADVRAAAACAGPAPRCRATVASRSRPACPGWSTSGSWSPSSSTTIRRAAGDGWWPPWPWSRTCSPTASTYRPASSSVSWCTSTDPAPLYPQVLYPPSKIIKWSQCVCVCVYARVHRGDRRFFWFLLFGICLKKKARRLFEFRHERKPALEIKSTKRGERESSLRSGYGWPSEGNNGNSESVLGRRVWQQKMMRLKSRTASSRRMS